MRLTTLKFDCLALALLLKDECVSHASCSHYIYSQRLFVIPKLVHSLAARVKLKEEIPAHVYFQDKTLLLNSINLKINLGSSQKEKASSKHLKKRM